MSYLGVGASRRSTLASEDGSTPQHPTALLWRGSDGGTLFKHTGADCTFDGMSFWGRLDSDPGTDPPRAGIGLLLAPGPIATGKNHYGRIAVTHCDVGFQAGIATSDANCDNLNFEQVCFRNCDRGFVVKHEQGVKVQLPDRLVRRHRDGVHRLRARGRAERRQPLRGPDASSSQDSGWWVRVCALSDRRRSTRWRPGRAGGVATSRAKHREPGHGQRHLRRWDGRYGPRSGPRWYPR